MTPNWDPPEHPEDRSTRIRREAYGRTHAATFARAHMRTMTRLIEIYSDADAEKTLEGLRELFWAELWSPQQAESQEGTSVAQALPDTGKGSGPSTGVPSCDSPGPCDIERITADVYACAMAHEPGVRLIGNVRAVELVWLADHARELASERARLESELAHLKDEHKVLFQTWQHDGDLAENAVRAFDRIAFKAQTRVKELEQEKSNLLGSLGDSEEDAARAHEKLQEVQRELADAERKRTNVSMDLAEARGDLERARAFAAELTVREAELEQDLAFERAKNEGRVIEGRGL